MVRSERSENGSVAHGLDSFAQKLVEGNTQTSLFLVASESVAQDNAVSCSGSESNRYEDSGEIETFQKRSQTKTRESNELIEYTTS